MATIMDATQCKMARAATGLGIREIASKAGVSPNTVSRLERGEELKASTVAAIRAAFERSGVIFINENGEGAGVRMRKLKIGDQVKLVHGTLFWSGYPQLDGKVGIVDEVVPDGTSTHRVSVSFNQEIRIEGVSAGLFELVSPTQD